MNHSQSIDEPMIARFIERAEAVAAKVTRVADEAAAAKLQGRAYYDWVFQNEPKWAAYRNI